MSSAYDIAVGAVARLPATETSGYAKVIRSVVQLVEGDKESLPLLIVAVTDNGLEPAVADDERAYYGHYTLNVVLVNATAGVEPNVTHLNEREAVLKALADPRWPSPADVIDDVFVVRRPTLDVSKLPLGYTYSVLEFDIRTREAR